MRDHILLATGVFNVDLKEWKIQQIGYEQATPAHFVLISGADAAGSGPDLHSSRRIFGSQLDQAVVGKNHMRPVADEEVAVYFHPGIPQRPNFLEEGHGVKHDAIANDAAAAGAQDAAGHQLQNELLAFDNDRVSGVVAAGIARHHGEILREHVDDFAFALVAPLGADDDRSLTFFQMPTPLK